MELEFWFSAIANSFQICVIKLIVPVDAIDIKRYDHDHIAYLV